METRKPVREYIVGVPQGWTEIPTKLLIGTVIEEQEAPFFCSYLRKDGIQLTVSVRDYGSLRVIHISFAPVYRAKKDQTQEEIDGHLFDEVYNITKGFFGDRKFLRQPNTPGRPEIKHFFHVLEERK